jgi:hypothetical protein
MQPSTENMKQQKRSLSEALQTVATLRQPRLVAVPVTRGPSPNSQSQADQSPTIPKVLSARAGKRLIGGHFDKAVSRQLRELAAREDATVQALLGEAMNMLFAARGLPQIAEP